MIKAGDLTQDHVGKFISCEDPASGFVYAAEILRITRREDGRAPGVSIRLRHPALPSGLRSRDGEAHVPFDQEFELVDTT